VFNNLHDTARGSHASDEHPRSWLVLLMVTRAVTKTEVNLR
jgi:hypothetical protein